MSVLLRHPVIVPALFSRESEVEPMRPGTGAFWRGPSRPGRYVVANLLAGARAPGCYAVPLALLLAEAPMIKAATTLLSMALPH